MTIEEAAEELRRAIRDQDAAASLLRELEHHGVVRDPNCPDFVPYRGALTALHDAMNSVGVDH